MIIRDLLFDVSTRTGNDQGLRTAWNFTGISEHGKANYHEALNAYRLAHHYAEIKKDLSNSALILANMAITYREMGLPEMDIEYKKRAMEIFQELDDQAAVNNLKAMIALSIMADTRQPGEAERFVREAEAYYLQEDETNPNLVLLYNGLASIYQLDPNRNAYLYKTIHFNADSVAFYLDKAFSYPSNDFLKAHLAFTLSRYYLNKGEYEQSIKAGEDALALYNKTGQKYYLGWTLAQMAETCMYQNDFQKALQAIDQSREIFTGLGTAEALGPVYRIESEIRQRMGQTALALHLYKKGTALTDSITIATNLQRLSTLRTVLEQDILLNEKKKVELERDFERERASKEFERRKLFMVSTFLIVILAGLLIWRIREKDKHGKQLGELNQRLSHSETQLKELNLSKDKFFGILSHDLRSPLIAFESLCDRLFTSGGSRQDEIVNKMKDQSRKLRELLNNILLWSKSEQGLLKMKPRAMLVHDTISNVFELFFEEANQKNITLLNQTDCESLIFADPEAVHTILRNLINNAVKYTETGSITVTTEEHDDTVQISVTDTGPGITEEKKKELFEFSANVHFGLGLLLCRQLSERNNGSIQINSLYGSGTTVIITMPKFYLS